MNNRRGLTVTIGVAGAAVLTVLGTIGPALAGQRGVADDPMAGAPTVGTCSTLTPKQAEAPADHSAVVACRKPHTAQVAGVVSLPARLQWDTATDAALFRVIAGRCAPRVAEVLGRTMRVRDSSAYTYVWFTPTKAQRSQGARWLSCSVVLRQAHGLARLPRSTPPLLPAGRLPDRVARCLTTSAQSTTCSAAHHWRATGTFVVAGTYPGTKALNAKATHQCRSRVQKGKAYRWTYLDRTSWNVGHDHVVVCYSRTSR